MSSTSRYARVRGRWLVPAVVALIAAGSLLAACQSVKNVSDVNDTTQVRETVRLFEDGLFSVSRQVAMRDINAWQFRLREEDAADLDEVAGTLDDLEAELGAQRVDGAAAGRVLVRLGEQTRVAAAVRSDSPERLDELSQLLIEVGRAIASNLLKDFQEIVWIPASAQSLVFDAD